MCLRTSDGECWPFLFRFSERDPCPGQMGGKPQSFIFIGRVGALSGPLLKLLELAHDSNRRDKYGEQLGREGEFSGWHGSGMMSDAHAC